MRVPPLETERLVIRPFTMEDLEATHRFFDIELRDADLATEGAQTWDARRQWLQWAVLNYEELAKLRQPPYGDRAVTLKSTGELIGACGYVPCLNLFSLLPTFRSAAVGTGQPLYSTEFGLFWAISPAHRRQGYATEAARALIDYAFAHLRLHRVVATTTHDNIASMGVMRKLGMRIEKNLQPEPPWLQVVGIRESHAP